MKISKALIALILITITGIIIRLLNISEAMLYPDSYQGFLIAHNILNYGSVVGTLGENGMVYPYVSFWTRPGYPFLIILANFFVNNLDLAAHIVSFVSGVLIIPASYWLTKLVLKNERASLGSALLSAVSFNILVWGGFGLGDTTGVLSVIVFLIFLMKNRGTDVELGNLRDIFTGVVLGYAMLTRYEYAVLIVPLCFYIFLEEKKPIIKIANILLSALLLVNVTALLFFPIADLTYGLTKNVIGTSTILLVSILGITVTGIVNTQARQIISKLILNPLFLLGILLTVAILATQFEGIRNFILYDFVIITAAILGLTYLYKSKEHNAFLIFSITSLITLGIIYFRINPDMQRYWMHLFPFFIAPAGMVFSTYFKKKYLSLLMFSIVPLQIIISLNGVKGWQNGEWVLNSYDEVSATILNEKLGTNENLLITSLPESYFYFTGNAVHSISNEYPYVFIDAALDDQEVYIIQDIGMDFYFPNFSNFLKTELQLYIFENYFVNQNLLLERDSHNEKQPVNIYKINLRELKQKIRSASISFAANL